MVYPLSAAVFGHISLYYSSSGLESYRFLLMSSGPARRFLGLQNLVGDGPGSRWAPPCGQHMLHGGEAMVSR